MQGDILPSVRKDDPSPIIAREGWIIILGVMLIGSLLAAGAWRLGSIPGVIASVLAAGLTMFCLWFFRDPPRSIPTQPGVVVSAADGVVVRVDRANPPEELRLGTQPMTRIVVFLNVFNVHVNLNNFM